MPNIRSFHRLSRYQETDTKRGSGSKASNPNPWVLRLQGPSVAPRNRQGGAGAQAAAGSTPPPERDAEKEKRRKRFPLDHFALPHPPRRSPGDLRVRFLAKGKGAGEGALERSAVL